MRETAPRPELVIDEQPPALRAIGRCLQSSFYAGLPTHDFADLLAQLDRVPDPTRTD